MEQLIKKYCKNPHISTFNKLPKKLQEEFIHVSFQILSQKIGNQKKALEILTNLKLISIVHGYTVYTGPKNIDNQLTRFTRLGVITIPVIPPEQLKKTREEFLNTLHGFPEYERHPKDPSLDKWGKDLVYVLGGFAALGNPASFHNMFVRNLRMKCRKKAIIFFRKLIDSYYDSKQRNNYKVEVLFDRMMYRKAGQKAVAEAWHRDVIPPKFILPTDEVFGGWVNLDSKDQYFSCIPGSQLGIRQRDIPSGFDTMTRRETANILKNNKEVRDKFNKMPKKKGEKYMAGLVKPILNEVGKKRHKFVIRPGHMIIFPQYIMHEVVANAVKHDMYRLFLGWRMTISENPLKNIDKIMSEQSVVSLPGGMVTPMYASSHQSQQLGIPTIKTKDKKFKLDKWVKDMSIKYMVLYPSDKMKKLNKQLKTTDDKRKVIAAMNQEYLDRAGIQLDYDQKEFLSDEDNILSFRSVFRTNPKDDDSKTTLIKWSNDTFPKNMLERQKYDGGGGKGVYMRAPRYMKSLKQYGLKMYPKYSEKEKSIYRPSRV